MNLVVKNNIFLLKEYFMKKIIAVLAAMAVTSISAFALDITVGARGDFFWGLGTTLAGDSKDYYDAAEEAAKAAGHSWKTGGNLGGGFAVYGNFGFLNLGGGTLGVQPEVGMIFNNGWNLKDNDDVTNKTYTSIEIPVLVTFTYPIADAFSIGGGIGPYISIPLNYDQLGNDGFKMSDYGDIKTNFMNFGLAFDVNAGYKVGPGDIVLDVRYMLDFTNLHYTLTQSGVTIIDEDTLVRRGLLIGLGYQIKF